MATRPVLLDLQRERQPRDPVPRHNKIKTLRLQLNPSSYR